MRKKGQLTIFIIIGIIVFISIIIFLVLRNNSNKNNEIINPINKIVNDCIDTTTNEGIRYIMFQGGYYVAPKNAAKFMFFEVPYYFNEGKESVPEIASIENELSKYIVNELPKCLNFSNVENQGYVISKKEISVKSILGEETKIKISYPITITKDKKIVTIKDFSYSNELDFEKIHDIIKDFSIEHKKNPDHIPIGYISKISNEKEFLYNINYLTESDIVYSLIFPEILGINRTLIYNFASRYKWDEIKKATLEQTNPIIFEQQPILNAYTGKKFSYQIIAKGNDIKYQDYSGLFDIDENNGKIEFIPETEDSGEHEILIKAIDNKGNEETQVIYLNIEKTIEEGFNLTK